MNKDYISKTTHWNYRVLMHTHPNDVNYRYFKIHEVYYTDGIPDGYSKDAESLEADLSTDLPKMLNLMELCLKKPMIFADDFPKEVIVKYKCLICERDNFDKKTAHKCGSNFRKHKIRWEKIYK